jgi:hypothetical protein
MVWRSRVIKMSVKRITTKNDRKRRENKIVCDKILRVVWIKRREIDKRKV